MMDDQPVMEDLACCGVDDAACCDAPVMVAARGVSVRYRDQLTLDGVDLDLRRNRILAIIGPSGCGKSTFLATLNRLCDMIPGCHVDGSVAVDGADIRDGQADVRLLRCKVGMIFQKPNPFPLSIRRNIDMPLKEHGVASRKDREERMEEVLTEVGLWREVRDRLDQPALSLSGGQQQRLCIARALALRPEVLLMDEPCSALDPISSAVIEDLILRLKERYTIAIVTHNLAQARRIADDLAIFWTVDGVGRVIEQGPAETLFAAPANPISASYLSGARG
jgi:phosphate transport system ATP-binding protein